MITYTAKYLKIESGYMGQLVEWPEILTEGTDLDECRAMLRDALQEMFTAYVQLGKEMPVENILNNYRYLYQRFNPETQC